MSRLSSPNPPALADFAAIEAAVMETERGRWFLAEFARRNRNSDTSLVLEAIGTMQGALLRHRDGETQEALRQSLRNLATALAAPVSQEATSTGDLGQTNRLRVTAGELNEIAKTTEGTTSTLLAAAEKLQGHAWSMRERGIPGRECDVLEAIAAELFAVCGFQDVTAQRLRAASAGLGPIEASLAAVVAAVDCPPRSVTDSARPQGPTTSWPVSAGDTVTLDDPLAPAQATASQHTFAQIDGLTVGERLRLFC